MATERVVIIIPTYNEKGNIDRLVAVLLPRIFSSLFLQLGNAHTGGGRFVARWHSQ
jgi:hypothetical protein